MCPALWDKGGTLREFLADQGFERCGICRQIESCHLSWPQPLIFLIGRSYGLTEAVGGAVFEAPLIVRRVFSGTRPSDGCSILAGCIDDKCSPVLIWPSILIDWPLWLRRYFGLSSRFTVSSGGHYARDLVGSSTAG